jgi:hypothetical protein
MKQNRQPLAWQNACSAAAASTTSVMAGGPHEPALLLDEAR